MQYNTILQKEKEIQTLKRNLKRLKENAVTVNLIGENSNMSVNRFITLNFDHLIYEETYNNGVQTLILKAAAYDVYRAILLAAKHSDAPADTLAAYNRLAEEVNKSEGKTKHQI